jgi:hypothetical protein
LSSSRPSVLGKNSMQEPSKSASSIASMGRTPSVQCHCCHGFGHMQWECPSQRAYMNKNKLFRGTAKSLVVKTRPPT